MLLCRRPPEGIKAKNIILVISEETHPDLHPRNEEKTQTLNVLGDIIQLEKRSGLHICCL